MKKIIFIALLLSTFTVKAQVGINTLNPDTSAILHIYGSGTKGLLIPEMSQEVRGGSENITPANGLLAYDPVQKMYFFFNGKEWISLNPLQSRDNLNDTMKLSNGHNKMIFNSNMTIIGTVNFQNQATFNGQTIINNTLTTQNINAGVNSITAGSANIGGATIKANKIKVDTIEARIGAVQSCVLSGTGSTGASASINNRVLNLKFMNNKRTIFDGIPVNGGNIAPLVVFMYHNVCFSQVHGWISPIHEDPFVPGRTYCKWDVGIGRTSTICVYPHTFTCVSVNGNNVALFNLKYDENSGFLELTYIMPIKGTTSSDGGYFISEMFFLF